jgi:hypothetical protein
MSSLAINKLMVPGQVLEQSPAQDARQQAASARGAEPLALSHARGEIVSDVCWHGRPLLDGIDLTLIDHRARYCRVPLSPRRSGAERPDTTITELVGQARGLCFTVNLTAYPRAGLLKLDVAVHNPNRARHVGGLWDLGDAGSIFFKELALEARFHSLPAGAALRPEPSSEWLKTERASFDVYQDSSGGPNWQSENHVNRYGRVPMRFRGYRLRIGAAQMHGLRAQPVAVVHTDRAAVALAVSDFWQQFPKAMELDGRVLRVGLFPRQWDDLHELQAGERKTHTVWLKFASDFQALRDCVLSPVIIRPDVESLGCRAALPPLDVPSGPNRDRLDAYLGEALNRILANRERTDEYGWRHFGDLYADHEETHYKGSAPLVSHYNNQFDPLLGFLLQFIRTGGRRWFELADALARHVADIDIYHTQRDRAVYNGGLFWFTDHYVHAATATHRTYSRANVPAGQPYGGGPSTSHLFTTGLRLHHLLTGNPQSKAAVVELADWVLAMDDGRNTLLGVLDDGPTGAGSSTADSFYHGPGRGAGNALNAVLDAWDLSGSGHYLDCAEQLIRRVVHPHDDIDALDLLNVEKRWSYTVFLSSLAKYLDMKAAAGDVDFMYAYARAALVHYGQWMAVNERPYFDQTEKLEFPTEAWAAQEFRKANVLRHAARFADEPARSLMFKRGEELADRAWDDLARFESRTTIRAVAIVMAEGLWDCAYRGQPLPAAPTPPNNDWDFGTPTPFQSQRQRIKRALKSPLGLGRMVLRLLNPARWLRVRWRLR